LHTHFEDKECPDSACESEKQGYQNAYDEGRKSKPDNPFGFLVKKAVVVFHAATPSQWAFTLVDPLPYYLTNDSPEQALRCNYSKTLLSSSSKKT
jgi:hypothetical protein